MKMPENTGATAAGSVSRTAASAASGATRITLYPRYAASMRNARAARTMMNDIKSPLLVVCPGPARSRPKMGAPFMQHSCQRPQNVAQYGIERFGGLRAPEECLQIETSQDAKFARMAGRVM